MSFFSRNKRWVTIASLLAVSAVVTTLFQECSIDQLEILRSKEAELASSQNSSEIYDIVEPLTSPNIGVHWGAIENNQAAVDRIINIDPTSAPDVKSSAWYLTQWKKKTPLMLNKQRQDPVITNSSYRDGYLGQPLFEVNSPKDAKFGIETSLLIYNNPIDQSKVFEIVGRNGYLNQYGGSNVFLTGRVINEDQAVFSNDISLSFNGKVSRLKSTLNSRDRDAISIGFILTGYTAYNVDTKDSMFVQISHADTRRNQSEYRGCYMHGENLEIVYSHNLDNDFVSKADLADIPLKKKVYNLNRYLCAALKGNFNCPSGVPASHLSSLRKDLSKWKFTGFYTGAETQSSRAPTNSPDSPGPLFGEVEVGMQYNQLKVSANTGKTYLSCDDVEGKRSTPAPKPAPTPNQDCSKSTFKDGSGNTIEYSCGCGPVPGGVLQRDGCYHRRR